MVANRMKRSGFMINNTYSSLKALMDMFLRHLTACNLLLSEGRADNTSYLEGRISFPLPRKLNIFPVC